MNVPTGVRVTNPLHIQWNPPWNQNWINASNVLDHFTNTMNPFYDANCLNEQIRIQRLSPEVMARATGVEYTLLHAADPVYVIRKQYRSANQITPLEDYYIIGGTVYKAPDVSSLLNCRLQVCLHRLRTAFEELRSAARLHQSRGHCWQVEGDASAAAVKQTKGEAFKQNVIEDIRASAYQMKRMNALIDDLVRRFPIPMLEEMADMETDDKQSAVKGDAKPVEKQTLKREEVVADKPSAKKHRAD